MTTASPILLLKEVDEDTDIEWWTTNRKKLNEVIRSFNQWQLNGFSEDGRTVVSQAVADVQEFGDNNSFSEWQFDIIKEMRQHLEKTVDIDPAEYRNSYISVPGSFFEKLHELAENEMSRDGREELKRLLSSVHI